MYTLRIFAIISIWLMVVSAIRAQDTLLQSPLSAVTIEADRLGSAWEISPLSLTQIGKIRIQQANQQLGISESLGPVPGLNVNSSNNFSQDLRISIRGFGARSAFGIRGVRILVEGIPESTPDGQAQVDILDPGIIQGIEVLRGPSASLFGNAAGGALLIQTEDIREDYLIEGRLSLGSFGFQKYQLKAGWKSKNWKGIFYGSQTSLTGYRTHSAFQQTYINGRIHYNPTDNQEFTLLAYLANSPLAQDPGGVDSAQFTQSPELARDRNVQFQAGETVQQARIALKYAWRPKAGGKLQARTYFTDRRFANFLPFENGGRVRLNRDYGGGGISYQRQFLSGRRITYKVQLGMDLDLQRDLRQQFQNLEGVQGELTGQQLEAFSSSGIYLLNQFRLGRRWLLQANTRMDVIWLRATDQFEDDEDNSGSRQYQRLNPSVGASYAWLPKQYIFTNLSTSFETPTLSELSANPEGLAGFNSDLDPQRARSLELGIKGIIQNRIRYSLNAYTIRLEGELLPFEVAGQQGRTFFRNAGRSRRNGLEAYLKAEILQGINLTGSYAYQSFLFEDFDKDGVQLAGNRLPGIPVHSYYLEAAYTSPQGLFLRTWMQGRGGVFADDENTQLVSPAHTLQVRFGYTLSRKRITIQPFFGLNNLLNARYPDNIRLNAFGGRYFEAATARSLFAGLLIRFSGSKDQKK